MIISFKQGLHPLNRIIELWTVCPGLNSICAQSDMVTLWVGRDVVSRSNKVVQALWADWEYELDQSWWPWVGWDFVSWSNKVDRPSELIENRIALLVKFMRFCVLIVFSLKILIKDYFMLFGSGDLTNSFYFLYLQVSQRWTVEPASHTSTSLYPDKSFNIFNSHSFNVHNRNFM